ncbi:Carboxylic acid transporter protein-like protein [Gluconacetobacter sp. SXCC-1]|uniref:MFS transporter n=1 Tax=Komagataeibacter rhaeticus TaxID=215221 RepID=A0A181CAL4_9PROT|nr:MFS transporter [Komagataeibacter rhaeticus]ATU72886.1 MFS transporter [Komagataeibacter xylinus]EGG76667.1 Carboxylic acid transporter protein-like protein [Gluconacetobacter sp. SXCC-1]QIP35376.1 MFS transporter [Komagataeibacter rhaeticus]QOC47943.1 MFS transporter [Komagataeibacter rhaeticus]WPP22679.1 MFS transporter [Komagataeibacter rhaeticus]
MNANVDALAIRPDTGLSRPALVTARHVVVASFLAWMLDACDFFIVLFTLDDVARGFGVSLQSVLLAPTLTLLTRPIGAFLCGRAADRYGRKPVMITTIMVYSAIEILSAFAPTLGIFLLLRALFGVALGGEWGVGTSLIMESVPPSWRGMASGTLQAGYPAGYLLASLVFLLLPVLGWRGLFVLGGSALFSALYIWLRVPESPEWLAQQKNHDAAAPPATGLGSLVRGNMALCVFAVTLMAAFNFMSHGSQDLYPKIFLGLERGLSHPSITLVVVLYDIAAIAGGLFFGMLSQRIGRQHSIALAALLTLPLLPLWTLPHSTLWLTVGAVCIQFCIQGAWGVVPAYLSELSPPWARATFPGLAYQCGNLLAASNALIQTSLATLLGTGLALPLMLTVGLGALVVLGLTLANARLHPAIR